MRHLGRLQLIAAAVLVILTGFTQTASADPITESVSQCGGCGYTFQATLNSLGSNNYSLLYMVTNVSGAPATPQSWSLTLFPSGSTAVYSDNSLSAFSTVTSTNQVLNYYTNAYTVM